MRSPRRIGGVVGVLLTVATLVSCTKPGPPPGPVAETAMRLPRHAGVGPVIDQLTLGDSWIVGSGGRVDGQLAGGHIYRSADDPRLDTLVRHRTRLEWVNPVTFKPGDEDCYRSLNNATHRYHTATGSRGADINDACAGDTVPDVRDRQGLGFTRAERDEVDLIFLSIGGNDTRFIDLVMGCFVDPLANGPKCREALQYIADNTARVVEETRQLIRQLLTDPHKGFRHAKLVLLGYPELHEGWDRSLPLCDAAGRCQPIYPARELQPLVQQAEELQCQMVAQLARELGGRVIYQSLMPVFAGHNVGSTDPWVYGQWATPDYKEWFHPTPDGWRKISEALLANAELNRALGRAA